ncbi:MAG: hypothetical protein ACLP6E_12080 [Acidimicrobiales bacterium]
MRKRRASMPGAGFGMIGLVLSLAVVAVGGAVGGTMLIGGSSGNDGLGNGTGSPANKAYDVAAESTLETAQSTVETVATTSGYSGITAQSLEFDEPSLDFTSGASTNNTTVSVAASPGTASGVGQLPVQGTGGTGTSSGGSVTLASYSDSTSGTGSCLFIWMTSGSTWYGAEEDQTSCRATALSQPPSPGSPSPSTIGWAQGSYPSP